MLLDNALFIPKAWLRFIPNPDMLQTWKKTKWEDYTANNTAVSSMKKAHNCRCLKWCNLSEHMQLKQNLVYLLMVKGWRAGCCLGMQMILGELRLGLPSPELPILLVLPLIPMPWPTWEWFSMFLEFIGNVPLSNNCQVWLGCIILSFSTDISVLSIYCYKSHKYVWTWVCNKWTPLCIPAWWWRSMEGHGGDPSCGGDMTW